MKPQHGTLLVTLQREFLLQIEFSGHLTHQSRQCLPIVQEEKDQGRRHVDVLKARILNSAQCTGQPGPCANCSKTGTYCHFDLRLDGRRKHAYGATDIHHRQQFILDALLRSIKYNDADLVQRLVEAIRLGRPLLEVATTLQDNIRALQGKLLSKEHQVTQSDMISLALNCLSDSDFRPHGNCRPSFPQHQTLVRGHSIRVTKNRVVLDGASTNAMSGMSMDQTSQQCGGRSQASGAKETCHRQRNRDRTKLSGDTLGMGGPGSPFIIAPYMDLPPALSEHCQLLKSPQRKHEWSAADSCTMYHAPQQHQHQDQAQVHASTAQRFTFDNSLAYGRQQPLGYFPNYLREHEIGQPATYIHAEFNTT
ncbi:hypothetical protein LTR14_012022 [Exophiala xenobiotica]|nr:hypothetical protein LTR14_012022 [Exophiala xenobiotica]